MGRLNFDTNSYGAYVPSQERLNRFRNPFKPKDEMNLSDAKFEGVPEKKESYSPKPYAKPDILLRQAQQQQKQSAAPAVATESEVDSYIFNISNDSSGSTLLGSSTGEGTAGQGLMASFPRAVSRKNTPSYANNQQYVELTNSNPSAVMTYNKEKSTFEAARHQTPQNESRPISRAVSRSFRPVPKFSLSSSHLRPSGGIEFGRTEASEQYESVVLSKPSDRRRAMPSQNGRIHKETMSLHDKGIESSETEYKTKYNDYLQMDEDQLKKFPNWYDWQLDNSRHLNSSLASYSSSPAMLDTAGKSKNDPILSVNQKNTFRDHKYSYF